ncbi:MAG TPA: DUF3348 family protein [Dyella sp.]|nr:DUF3348 family protein [Dyella sp.]
MAQAAFRPSVRGPTFIRLLARLAEIDVAAPGQSLPDRLGGWLDWTQALSLAAALDSAAATPDTAAAAPDDLAAECARVRDTLLAAIHHEPLLAAGSTAAGDADFAPYRQAYLARQRAMQASVGRLRGRLRDALLQLPARPGHPDAAPARLAEVDAVMEVALTPREHGLLARVPDLLARRFERLHAAGEPHRLDLFRREMQSVLLAELDLRFQPVDALLAALRTHQESAC